MCFFYLIVSDPIVTRKCLSVRDDHVAFPIDFFEAYHRHYTPIRCCAQRFGPHIPPHMLFGWRKNHKMAKPYTSARTAFFMKRVRKSWALVQARASFSCFFYFLQQKTNTKNMSSNLRKLSSRSYHSSTFAFFGGLENEPPRALWTPRWLQHFS